MLAPHCRTRPEHAPRGNPCELCGAAAEAHRVRVRVDRRVEHAYTGTGDRCEECGLGFTLHRDRSDRAFRSQAGRAPRPWRDKGRRRHKACRKKKKARLPKIYGIDGEGQGHAFVEHCTKCSLPRLEHKPENFRELRITPHEWDRDSSCAQTGCRIAEESHRRHLYTYLAIVDETGEEVYDLYDKEGLSTVDCLDLIIRVPARHLFGFSFGYDLTKMLEDMPAGLLYDLFHEKERERADKKTGMTFLIPIRWKGYKLNYMNKRLTVQRTMWDESKRRWKDYGKSVCVWDSWRFFACSFVEALKLWKIAPADVIKKMKEMKDKRGSDDWNIDKLNVDEMKRYCQDECAYLAQLIRALIQSHEDVDLELRNFFGAGSTASALLDLFNIRESMQPPPDEMREALASAFFGGRFECSRVGPIPGPIYNYDIASAYPYQTTFLPCLIHGRWEHVRRPSERRIAEARLALIHARVGPLESGSPAWGPLPWRSPGGDILFPLSQGGVWTWKDEYQAARRGWPAVRATEAWLYECDCACQPFGRVPEYYKWRCSLGKEGKGIVIKLGLNSIYGKLAQSIGIARFNSWIYAGNITSGTRALLLDAICSARDRNSILMVATDGIFSREKLTLPKPRDTGTFELVNEKGETVTDKALGSWGAPGEKNPYKKGIFIVRPGVYFPLGEMTDEAIKDIKSRGIAKRMLLENTEKLLDHWKRYKWYKPIDIPGTRFVGAKSSIRKNEKSADEPYTRGETYGEWCSWPIQLGFQPGPKRRAIVGKGKLVAWEKMVGESTPYDRALISQDAQMLRGAEEVANEQPDAGDWS